MLVDIKSNLCDMACRSNKKCKHRKTCCYSNSKYARYLTAQTDSIDTRHPNCFIFKSLPIYSVSLFLSVTFIFFVITGFLSASAQDLDITNGQNQNITQSVFELDIGDLRSLHGLSEPVVPAMVVYAESRKAEVYEDLFNSVIEYTIEEPIISSIKETIVPKTTPKPTVVVQTVSKKRGSYTEDDIYVLNKIVQAEAGGEPYNGKLSVANVILNRQEKYGGTIRDIVFASNQFSPVANGSFDNAIPNEATIKAVQDAINGQDNSNGALYFLNEKTSSSKWVPLNRTYSHAIANHTFYK